MKLQSISLTAMIAMITFSDGQAAFIIPLEVGIITSAGKTSIANTFGVVTTSSLNPADFNWISLELPGAWPGLLQPVSVAITNVSLTNFTFLPDTPGRWLAQAGDIPTFIGVLKSGDGEVLDVRVVSSVSGTFTGTAGRQGTLTLGTTTPPTPTPTLKNIVVRPASLGMSASISGTSILILTLQLS